ncbi:acyltransferase family protein [Brucella pseudogrignonensis]
MALSASGRSGFSFGMRKPPQVWPAHCLPLFAPCDIPLEVITPKAENMGNSGHQNSLDAMRFVLSSAVLFSHHFALSGYIEPKFPLLDISVGNFAVFAFFAVSGFLMYRSLNRSNDFFFYFTSRVLRLAPGLIVAVVITSLVLMLVFDNFLNFSSHLYYVQRDSFSFISEPSYFINGIFDERPNRGVNGSLWTLQYEFFMYISIFCVFALPRRVVPFAIIFLLFSFLFSYYFQSNRIYHLGTFHLNNEYLLSNGFHFLSGALVAHFWPSISANRVPYAIISSCSAAVFILVFPLERMVGIGFLWIPFLIACMSPIVSKFSKLGDASYGVYIYAFPIQQTMITFLVGFWTSMAVAFLATVGVSFLSWHLIEKTALYRRKNVSMLLSDFSKRLRI